MSRKTFATFTSAVCCIFALVAAPIATAQTATTAFPIGWLNGCWTLSSASRTVEEHWMSPRGGAMLGMSRTVNSGKMTETEFVILEQAGDTLRYKVRAGKQAEVVFSARAPFADEIIFENLNHDFPKRVAYKRINKDSVEAWIDGGAAAGGKKISYPYHRQQCAAP